MLLGFHRRRKAARRAVSARRDNPEFHPVPVIGAPGFGWNPCGKPRGALRGTRMPRTATAEAFKSGTPPTPRQWMKNGGPTYEWRGSPARRSGPPRPFARPRPEPARAPANAPTRPIGKRNAGSTGPRTRGRPWRSTIFFRSLTTGPRDRGRAPRRIILFAMAHVRPRTPATCDKGLRRPQALRLGLSVPSRSLP